MKKELKTLKDFETNLDEKCSFEGIEIVHIQEIIRQLKAEAIKWVKDRLNNAKGLIPPNHTFTYNMAQAKVLNDFFNLTSEDLK